MGSLFNKFSFSHDRFLVYRFLVYRFLVYKFLVYRFLVYRFLVYKLFITESNVILNFRLSLKSLKADRNRSMGCLWTVNEKLYFQLSLIVRDWSMTLNNGLYFSPPTPYGYPTCFWNVWVHKRYIRAIVMQ